MSAPVVPVSLGSPAFRSCEVGGFRVVSAEFPPWLRLAEHAHEWPTFAVVVDGGFEKHLLRGHQVCRPWTVVIEPAGERHANLFGPRGARVLILQPEPSETETLGSCQLLFGEPHHFQHVSIAALARRAMDELAVPDDVSPLALEGLGLEMLVLGQRRSSALPTRTPQPWLRRLEALLRARFQEPLRMGTLATEVDLHPVYVARVFHAHYGVTVATYVRQLRIAFAQEQLRKTDAVVSQVALAAGFSDQSHFTRAFTRVAGVSPLRWRRRALAQS